MKLNPSGTSRRSWRRVALAAALLPVLIAAGCSSSGNSSGTSPAKTGSSTDGTLHNALPSSIKSAGVIKVASTFGYPPEEFYEEDNTTPTGISVDLANALGKVLGVKFEFSNVEFPSIVPGLLANRYDVGIAALSATPERIKQLTFVLYMNSGATLLTQAGNPKNIKTLADLCGRSDAAIQGTTFITKLQAASTQDCTSKGKQPIDIQIYQNPSERLAAVLNGRADVSYTAFDANAYTAQGSKGKLMVIDSSFVPDTPYGIAMTKDNSALAKALQGAMKVIISNGEYAKVMKKWGVAQAELTDPKILGD